MKRFIFFIILAGGIVGSSAVVLFMNKYLPAGAIMKNGNKIMYNFVKGVAKGTFKFGTTPSHVFIYAMFAFLVINAGIFISMILLFLLSGLTLFRIKRFYRISLWYLFSALILTASWMWFNIKTTGGSWNLDAAKELMWIPGIPLISALVTVVLGLVFSIGRRR
ncbi:MAG: hypothetical protein LBG88_00810 [Christensenellaceae bacterium]|jgi:hypothetical protein|nr:hypothetical protein [Christensenellaceae bacterium]